ncbi:ABC_tran domain-containing protein [Cephalotus follicularis]|uniref:ABC_tran domain-containing protein n=1 Tax=Cephalotus follicularis TaxID=3775 RepID=A0A1Q3BI08_CEPFO|nr:ABC_tran domain-containing protein [Cephalotus follicularis]
MASMAVVNLHVSTTTKTHCTLSSPSSSTRKLTILPSHSLLFHLPAIRPLHLHHRSLKPLKATLSAVDTPAVTDGHDEGSKPLLEIRGLTAVIAESKQQILKGVNLVINQGEVHAVMGKNGSGKSTLSKVITGHPDYEVTGGSIVFKGENLLHMEPEERSLAGIFMSFQSPIEIPGVNIVDFLLMGYNERRKKLNEPEVGPLEFLQILSSKLDLVNMKSEFLGRNVNEGFSGGERKRNEILQLAVLGADLAILDEIDSGLDVDALRDVGKAVNGLLTPNKSILMITHYQQIFKIIEPTFIHIMDDGRIVKTGDIGLAKVLDKEGYKSFSVP